MSSWADLQELTDIVSKPSKHPIKDNTIIICFNDYSDITPITRNPKTRRSQNRWKKKLKIVELNLDTNELNNIDIMGISPIHKYGSHFTDHVYDHRYDGNFIDTQNQKIHIFGGGNYAIFDFNNNILQQIPKNALSECGKGSVTTYVPSQSHPEEIHILTKNMIHYKININGNTVSKMIIWEFIEDGIYVPKLLYTPFKNQLLSLGSCGSNKIWYCNIDKMTDAPRGNWRLSTLKMPRINSAVHKTFDSVLAFENIILIFYAKPHSDIWCIDLLNDQIMKTNYDLHHYRLCSIYVFIDDNNYVHIIDFKNGIHDKLNLLNLVPKNVIT
eukprot:199882_1